MIESLPYSKQIFDLYLKGIYNFETIVFSIGTLTSNSFQSSVVQASVLQNFNDRLLVPAMEGKLCKLSIVYRVSKYNGGKIFLHFCGEAIDCDCCGCLEPDVGLDDVFVLQGLGLI